jgi:hypothetical protein
MVRSLPPLTTRTYHLDQGTISVPKSMRAQKRKSIKTSLYHVNGDIEKLCQGGSLSSSLMLRCDIVMTTLPFHCGL